MKMTSESRINKGWAKATSIKAIINSPQLKHSGWFRAAKVLIEPFLEGPKLFGTFKLNFDFQDRFQSGRPYESAEAMKAALQEMQGSVGKLAPNMGVVSSIVNCISEAIIQVDDYRPGSRNDGAEAEEGLVTFQTRMMTSTKEIAKTAQEIVIKSSSDPSQLGGLANHISTNYQSLATDTRGAINNTENTDMANRIKSSVQDLGQVTIELVKSTGSCQTAQNDSFVLRDVSENARNVGEKCSNVLSTLNALARGTHALENAANTVSGILGDLDTTIMFATAGTLNADMDEEIFAGK